MKKKIELTPFDRPEGDISYLIWQITKYWQRGRHKTLDEFGLTTSQLEVLVAIIRLQDKTEITQIALSQETNIDPMTISTILRNLQKKGMITRKESETDTRARVVELTEAGYNVLNKAMVKVVELQSTLFKNIDVEALRTQLKILLNELNKLEIQ